MEIFVSDCRSVEIIRSTDLGQLLIYYQSTTVVNMAKVVICLDGSQYAEDAYNCEYDKYCVAKCLM